MTVIRILIGLIQAVLKVLVSAIQAGLTLFGLGVAGVAIVAGMIALLYSLGAFGLVARRRYKARRPRV